VSVDSIPTILSIVFGLMTVLLAAALSAVVYLVLHSLRSISSDVQNMRSELTGVSTQLRNEARNDRDELRDGLRRVHERVDVVPHQFVRREDCIVAQNRLAEAVTRVDDKLDSVLKALKLPHGGDKP